ncbi:hypothetical protein BV22DRAFT_1130454 [Leucogyrophana mollusca]|uniref:Uncharacterized protein n=1 Tax=Leucogyrophana mollusca TaxID=85980 RepID=A0ACB8BDH1_9AGAM|nr:hypothetical protein BV22DRAFT_1130454 [Leucogyrophana mollusca]
MHRAYSLARLSEDERRRFITIGSGASETDSRALQVAPSWPRNKTYCYNTCSTLSVSTAPYISSPACTRSHWSVESPLTLEKLSADLNRVRPELEVGQPILPGDQDETIGIKESERYLLQVVLADIVALTPDNIEDPNVVWEGRHGWLSEYNKMALRRGREWRGSRSSGSREEYDSDYIFDSVSPPGERRASCTVSMDASDFE